MERGRTGPHIAAGMLDRLTGAGGRASRRQGEYTELAQDPGALRRAATAHGRLKSPLKIDGPLAASASGLSKDAAGLGTLASSPTVRLYSMSVTRALLGPAVTVLLFLVVATAGVSRARC